MTGHFIECGTERPAGGCTKEAGQLLIVENNQIGNGRTAVAGVWHHRKELDEPTGAVRPLTCGAKRQEAPRCQDLCCLNCEKASGSFRQRPAFTSGRSRGYKLSNHLRLTRTSSTT